jgi:hypothetical protein
MKLFGKTSSLISASLLFAVCSQLHAARADVGDFIKKGGKSIWTCSSEDFKKKNGSKKIYKWNSSQKRTLHYAANNLKGFLYFDGYIVTEADIDFTDDKLQNMSINIFNKTSKVNRQLGANKNTFKRFLSAINKRLDKFFGTRSQELPTKLINGTRCYSCSWQTPYAYAVLKWSYDGSNSYTFRAEYVSLYVYKNKEEFEAIGKTRVKSIDEMDLKSRIKTNADGDRYLEVPMVDQGKRGYCVVACAERILKYYNVNVDQHVLAQAANTSGAYGTSIEDIQESMKSVGNKCRFHVKEITEYEPLVGNFNILKFIKKYNSCARRADKKEIDVNRVRGYNHLFKLMDEDVLVETRIKWDKSGYRRFQKEVKESVDEGMPVFWSVMLGMIKEPKLPQSVGGHMRLIMGYNDKKGEIIYSDSWGEKHGFKKMSWGKAWAMTKMAHVFTPKK